MTAREIILDNEYEDVIIFENPSYDSAFVGVSECNRAIYDYDKMIECLSKEDNITYEDATDFISYNTIRALPYMGEGAPIIMYNLISE